MGEISVTSLRLDARVIALLGSEAIVDASPNSDLSGDFGEDASDFRFFVARCERTTGVADGGNGGLRFEPALVRGCEDAPGDVGTEDFALPLPADIREGRPRGFFVMTGEGGTSGGGLDLVDRVDRRDCTVPLGEEEATEGVVCFADNLVVR